MTGTWAARRGPLRRGVAGRDTRRRTDDRCATGDPGTGDDDAAVGGLRRRGGAASNAASAGNGAASSAPSADAASSAPSAAASEQAPASEAPSAGGGSAGGACDLVTADELASAFGVPSVKTTLLPGPPDSCVIESDAGKPLAAFSYTTAAGSALYDVFVLPGQSSEVSGIGDKAAFVDNTGFLVLKGDKMVVIVISGGAELDDDQVAEVSKQLGAHAAGRM